MGAVSAFRVTCGDMLVFTHALRTPRQHRTRRKTKTKVNLSPFRAVPRIVGETAAPRLTTARAAPANEEGRRALVRNRRKKRMTKAKKKR